MQQMMPGCNALSHFMASAKTRIGRENMRSNKTRWREEVRRRNRIEMWVILKEDRR